MPDHIIDTNVLLVASAHDPGSPFKDSDHVPVKHRQGVFEWLASFRRDNTRQVVLDQNFTIYNEYRNKMSDQDFGLQVMKTKMELFLLRQVNIDYDSDGKGALPRDLKQVVYDEDDRKMVAVALADHGRSTIVNACESDWYDWEEALNQAGVVIEHLIDDWCRSKWNDKRKH
jgi:hypothetical protein